MSVIVDISNVCKSAYYPLLQTTRLQILHLTLHFCIWCCTRLKVTCISSLPYKRETTLTSAQDCSKKSYMISVLIDMIASPRQTSFLKHWGVQKKSLLWACDQIVCLFPASVWPVISCMLFCTQLSFNDLAWLQRQYLSSPECEFGACFRILSLGSSSSADVKKVERFSFIESLWSLWRKNISNHYFCAYCWKYVI